MFTSDLTGAVFAYTLGKHNAPATKIKLTGLKFFNIIDGFYYTQMLFWRKKHLLIHFGIKYRDFE